MAKKPTSKKGSSQDGASDVAETKMADIIEPGDETSMAETDGDTELTNEEKAIATDTPDDTVESTETDEPETETDTEQDGASDPLSTAEERQDTAAAIHPPTVEPAKKGGAGAMVFGGIIAGAIGFGAAYFLPQLQGQSSSALDALRSDIDSTLSEQSGKIAELSEAVAASGGETEAVAALTADLSDISDSVAALTNRISDVEQKAAQLEEAAKASTGTPAVDPALQSDLAALKTALAAQQEQVAAMQAATEAAKQQVSSAAEGTLRRAAMARIQTALDSGSPFADALAEMNTLGITVPEELAAHATSGVSSLSDLISGYPDAARAALDAARSASAESGEGGGVTETLRGLLGARSLEPREGTSADAVLSRVEAAVRDGRLSDALVEMDGLPDLAKAQLAAWKSAVETRLAALTAAQSLSDTLN